MTFGRVLLFLSLALTLSLGSMRGDQIPRAAEVASRIDHEVQFEDVIKACAKSRTKNGHYLSFGAPYPKQVLSVWVPDEVFDQLPRDLGLIGRRVRIKGWLEPSPTGPMVTLTSPDDFELLEVKDAMLSKQILDGMLDRGKFAAAVAQKFWQEDFASIEQLVQDLQRSRERFSDGTWILSAVFEALEVNRNESDERFAEAGHKIDRWRTAYLDSAVAAIVEAGYHINLAVHVSSGPNSDTLTPEGQAKFKRELEVARQILETNPAAQAVPEYFVKMEMVAFEQGWKREAFFRLFEQASAREPDYYKIYFTAALYLISGHRDSGNWERFAEEQRQKHGAGGEGDVLYARIAWSMSVNYDDFFGKSAASWKIMASGFDLMMKQYPNSRWLKNSYALFAFKADDRARLRPALAAIKDDPDMTVWNTLEGLACAQRFADQE